MTGPVTGQALILVGGKGTRLGPLTAETPKPLLPVKDEPFLHRVLRHLIRFGFTDIILSAGYLAPVVEAAFPDGRYHSAQVRIVREPEALGTGGAIANCADLLEDDFLVLNGDSIFDIDLLSFVRSPFPSGAEVKLALREVEDVSRYGAAILSDGRVTEFAEKSGSGQGLVNGGIYHATKTFAQRCKAMGRPHSVEQDILAPLCCDGKVGGHPYRDYFLDIGLPDTLAQAEAELDRSLMRPAVFFDRDGVLNEDHGYVHSVDAFTWRPGAVDAVHAAIAQGYLTFVVTNQAGLARGYYSVEQMTALHDWMNEELRKHGGAIAQFYHCPHHPDGVVPEWTGLCDWRKPGPGMLNQAMADWPVDPRGSFLLGDQDSDIEAARAAGIAGHKVTDGPLDRWLARAATAA